MNDSHALKPIDRSNSDLDDFISFISYLGKSESLQALCIRISCGQPKGWPTGNVSLLSSQPLEAGCELAQDLYREALRWRLGVAYLDPPSTAIPQGIDLPLSNVTSIYALPGEMLRVGLVDTLKARDIRLSVLAELENILQDGQCHRDEADASSKDIALNSLSAISEEIEFLCTIPILSHQQELLGPRLANDTHPNGSAHKIFNISLDNLVDQARQLAPDIARGTMICLTPFDNQRSVEVYARWPDRPGAASSRGLKIDLRFFHHSISEEIQVVLAEDSKNSVRPKFKLPNPELPLDQWGLRISVRST